MLGLWAVLTLTGALFSAWLGYAGRAFAATLTAFAFFFLVMLLFAARGVENSLASRLGAGGGYLLGTSVFLVYLIYGLGPNLFAFTRAAAIAGLVFVPLALAASEKQKPPGAWEDFLILAGVWVAVKFSPSHWLWPYPGGRLAYVFTVLLCVNVALAAFVLLRHVNGIGYSIGWGRPLGFFILSSFLVFGCIAIPLGWVMHFIEFAPQWSHWKSLSFLSLGILFFTAWPEEFLFRGLLQNMLSRASNSELAGWWRSEEHTSELQSRLHLVCRLLLEKKKKYLQCRHPPASTHTQLAWLYVRRTVRPTVHPPTHASVTALSELPLSHALPARDASLTVA